MKIKTNAILTWLLGAFNRFGVTTSSLLREASIGNTNAPIRILLIADKLGATQTISFVQPLANKIDKGDCALVSLDDDHFAAIDTIERDCLINLIWRNFSPTHLILSRYAGRDINLFLEKARETQTPVICHLDDDLLNVPEELGPAKYRFYNEPSRIARLRQSLAGSNVIYTSTSALAEKLRTQQTGQSVIAGKIYCTATVPFVPPTKSTTLTIGYMGTSGHAHDLALVMGGISRILERYPTARFETFGTIAFPSELNRFGSRVKHHPAVADYSRFRRRLADLGWSIGLAPLCDVPFNAFKANTKWVEYSEAGIAVAASDHPVYRMACADGSGALVLDGKWEEGLRILMESHAVRHTMVRRAQDKLRRMYTVEILERQLLEVMTEAENISQNQRL